MASSNAFSTSLSGAPALTFAEVEEFGQNFTASGNSRGKGYKMFAESYVCEYKACDDEEVYKISAKCHRSMRKRELPHEVDVFLDKTEWNNGSNKILYYKCSCVAGEAACNHIFAVLYQSAHYSQLGTEIVPSTRSCTSAPQAWHRLRRDGFIFQAIQELSICNPLSASSSSLQSTLHKAGDVPEWKKFSVENFAPHYPEILTILPSQKNEVVKMVQSRFGAVPKGCVISYQQQIPESKACETFDMLHTPEITQTMNTVLDQRQQALFISLYIPQSHAINVERDTRSQANCDAWHRLRKFRLTSSNFGRVCGKQTDLQKLATSMVKGCSVQTLAMKRGLKLESEAVSAYTDKLQVDCLPCGLIIANGCSWLACSPDRRVRENVDGNANYGLLEIKCPTKELDNLPYLDKKSGKYLLKQTHNYYFQILGQMGITGSSWCDFVIYTPSRNLHITRVHFDGAAFDDMFLQLQDFYFNYFLPTAASPINSS